MDTWTYRMIALVQGLMMFANGHPRHPVYRRLERLETYLFRRLNREG